MARSPKTEEQKAMGAGLRKVREALDLTQADFAEKAGVGTTTIQGWEAGRNQIDVVALAWLAKNFGFTMDYVGLADIGGLRVDLAKKIQARQRGKQTEAMSPRMSHRRRAKDENSDDPAPDAPLKGRRKGAEPHQIAFPERTPGHVPPKKITSRETLD
jgi:transcriptional regulator with XRE-family HTH domain